MPGKNVPAIKVDTVGYPTGWRKVAISNVPPEGMTVTDETGTVALSIPASRVTPMGVDAASGDTVWRVDFSDLKKPGRYVIRNGSAKSDPFRVGDDVYRNVLALAQKAFYFQRTRTALVKPYAVFEGDEFIRAGISHAHDDVGWLFEDFPDKKRRIALDAGWHDAGNFDMYVPSTAPSAHGLLRAYERHPALFADQDTNIPESGNGVPDVLDEARWGLRWVLSMQAEDGGFRVREANAIIAEPGNVGADLDRTARWVDRVGSASTGKGCALAATAARVYGRFDKSFAARAEQAARNAWAWLERHPERVTVPAVGKAAIEQPYQLWDDGPAVKTDVGARFLAATEMWKSFRLPAALDSIRKLLQNPETGPYKFPYGSWTNLTRWGMTTLAFDPESPLDVREEAKKRLLTAALSMKEAVQKDGYLCATLPRDYYWGSNANLLDKAVLLATAAELDPSGFAWAGQAARDQWHWILGRNPNGFSMVTRVGKGPTTLYHAEWGPKFPKVPPGYLVNGPNHQDMGFLAPNAPAKALLWEAPHDLAESGVPKGGLWHWAQSDLWEGGFIPRDTWTTGWWFVNEPDIFYNMLLVGMAAEMQASISRPGPGGT
jgi:endoglucanase